MLCRPECVSGEEGQDFLRPVVRLPGKIFTRIDPKRHETSMVIRIREGWSDLSAYLRGEGTVEKRQRFKIWVCTAAERGYALEAWRLLDPTSELIPKDEVKKRLFCAGKQKKSLFRTFCLGPLHEQPVPKEILSPKKKLGPLCEGHSEMSMAIIVDDRIDVWEKRNQEQILQVLPFQYPCIETQSPSEIQKMQTVFQAVRSQFYFELMEQMAPAVRDMWKMGFENEAALQQLQEKMKRATSIAPFLNTFAQPTMAPAFPEAPVLTEASLKPNDRRQLGENRSNKAENGRISLPIIVKKKKTAKKPKLRPRHLIPPPPDESRMSLDAPSTSDQDSMQAETTTVDVQAHHAVPDLNPALREVCARETDEGTVSEVAAPPVSDPVPVEEPVEEPQEAKDTSLPLSVMMDVDQTMTTVTTVHTPGPVATDVGSLIPGLFEYDKMTSRPPSTAADAGINVTSVLAASHQLEALSVQNIQSVSPVQPSFLTQSRVTPLWSMLSDRVYGVDVPEPSPAQTQFLAVPSIPESIQNTSAAPQLRLIPGKVVLVPPTPAQGEASHSRYTIVQLSDGRLILQPVPPAPPRDPLPPAVMIQSGGGQQLGYVLPKNSAMNAPPIAPIKQWNGNWASSQPQLMPLASERIAGSYSKQLNIPCQLMVHSQPPNLHQVIATCRSAIWCKWCL